MNNSWSFPGSSKNSKVKKKKQNKRQSLPASFLNFIDVDAKAPNGANNRLKALRTVLQDTHGTITKPHSILPGTVLETKNVEKAAPTAIENNDKTVNANPLLQNCEPPASKRQRFDNEETLESVAAELEMVLQSTPDFKPIRNKSFDKKTSFKQFSANNSQQENINKKNLAKAASPCIAQQQPSPKNSKTTWTPKLIVKPTHTLTKNSGLTLDKRLHDIKAGITPFKNMATGNLQEKKYNNSVFNTSFTSVATSSMGSLKNDKESSFANNTSNILIENKDVTFNTSFTNKASSKVQEKKAQETKGLHITNTPFSIASFNTNASNINMQEIKSTVHNEALNAPFFGSTVVPTVTTSTNVFTNVVSDKSLNSSSNECEAMDWSYDEEFLDRTPQQTSLNSGSFNLSQCQSPNTSSNHILDANSAPCSTTQFPLMSTFTNACLSNNSESSNVVQFQPTNTIVNTTTSNILELNSQQCNTPQYPPMVAASSPNSAPMGSMVNTSQPNTMSPCSGAPNIFQQNSTIANTLGPKKVYIVVDTNVIIHSLETFKAIILFPQNNVVIYIPFQVWRELNHIKDGRASGENINVAKLAVKYISHVLVTNKTKLKGESVEEALDSTLITQGGDESILACCVGLRRKNFDVILLTNDVNLQNISLISNFQAVSSKKIMQVLKELPIVIDETCEDPRVQDILKEFSFLCSFIISSRLQGKYGQSWKAKVSIQPPWNVQQCLRLFLTLWSHVTMDSNKNLLPKQCLKQVIEFDEFLEKNGTITTEIFNAFKTYCLDICLYLKEGFAKYSKNIKNSTDKIRAKVQMPV